MANKNRQGLTVVGGKPDPRKTTTFEGYVSPFTLEVDNNANDNYAATVYSHDRKKVVRYDIRPLDPAYAAARKKWRRDYFGETNFNSTVPSAFVEKSRDGANPQEGMSTGPLNDGEIIHELNARIIEEQIC